MLVSERVFVLASIDDRYTGRVEIQGVATQAPMIRKKKKKKKKSLGIRNNDDALLAPFILCMYVY